MSTDSGSSRFDHPDLPVNAWAILGLLSFGHGLSGYQLRQWAGDILGYFHSVPAMSQIYTELKRLEAHGLVRPVDNDVGDHRSRRRYVVTPAGRAALSGWIRSSRVETATCRNGAMLRVWLGGHGDPARLREIVREHRDRCEELRTSAARTRTDTETDRAYARHRYGDLVIRWAERRYAAERDIAEQMLTELDDLDPG
ncbi:DNA-binding PadR family transcriptional regulator [Nocardiopsis mwathae]|uniref:DNA-binding PadR family transcriptional regulator n=1 Tax=Nocardiopsis mwathae TaxID=1472723 RepID=A0A7W9YEG5_9ACTN|nr:PadR family transcriptional regulator [Nocardiopsis mwathae]MBB6170680.1 DNA-binding PadR family transcriptional regulator [Nocardiopsis mwathae]